MWSNTDARWCGSVGEGAHESAETIDGDFEQEQEQGKEKGGGKRDGGVKIMMRSCEIEVEIRKSTVP